MAWTAMTHSISSEIIILYIAAIFWTLGYDTIYGAQDIADDEIIGMKSTSIKFKNSIKLFVGVCYLVSTVLISFLFYNQFGLNNFTILITTFILSLIYQIMKFKKTNPKKCLQAFKLNNISGFLLFLGIFLIN
jgi:4-hydroxybenzoate polyprenyltransferase